MKQSRLMSLIESFANIAIGYAIQCGAFAFFLPFFGFSPSLHDTLLFGLIMTVISVVRSFVLRRVFEALHIRRPLSAFMQAVIAERCRQIEVEGFSSAHDDAHRSGELATAGAAYLIGAGKPRLAPQWWPWDESWWKPQGVRRDLVRGATLAIAEGERFDRNRRRRTVIHDGRFPVHPAGS